MGKKGHLLSLAESIYLKQTEKEVCAIFQTRRDVGIVRSNLKAGQCNLP